MKNVESMFSGNFMIVSKLEKQIADRETGEITSYWEFNLSNGNKVLPVTCGKNSPLMEAKPFKAYEMEFTADFSRGYAKIKVTYIDGLEESDKPDAKPETPAKQSEAAGKAETPAKQSETSEKADASGKNRFR